MSPASEPISVQNAIFIIALFVGNLAAIFGSFVSLKVAIARLEVKVDTLWAIRPIPSEFFKQKGDTHAT